ncbi:MAG: hypothetical protein QQW96_13895 [Tychonema bourrellyi B0820]|uniref:hypothetical protein n=1 Tax=Tychonema bourrellyi TaxID=54313 RepID=UPI00117BFBFF|nr:hypothetical protein [Tychonema bourrellyi]MDQ2098728.1 hypothetical protein [Tychonema bourrellyi B0820]
MYAKHPTIYFDKFKFQMNDRTIEKNMDNLQQQFNQGTILTASQLQELQEQLKQLFSKAVTYTRLLRKLKNFDNTIAINLYNYIDILQKICVMIEGDKEELSILNCFSIKSSPYMRSQITGDLGYFRHGTSLIEQAIASIRGIVEIEQAMMRTRQCRFPTENNTQFQPLANGNTNRATTKLLSKISIDRFPPINRTAR